MDPADEQQPTPQMRGHPVFRNVLPHNTSCAHGLKRPGPDGGPCYTFQRPSSHPITRPHDTRIIDGIASVRALRAELAARVERLAAAVVDQGWRRSRSATTQPRRSTCATRSRPARRSAFTRSTSRFRARPRRARCSTRSAAECRPAHPRHPRAAAAAGARGGGAGARSGYPREGCGLLPPRERGPARDRPCPVHPLHPAGRDGDAGGRGREPLGTGRRSSSAGATSSASHGRTPLAAGATVTICNSKTVDLAAHTARADILVVAVGRAKLVTGSMIKPGAVVVDVGINRLPDGKLVRRLRFRKPAWRGVGGNPGAGRRRPDDDHDAARQHRARGGDGGAMTCAPSSRSPRGRGLARRCATHYSADACSASPAAAP